MDNTSEQELNDRLSLIERMIAEGRRNTESYGWTFVLWGVAQYVAIGWSAWGHSAWAWPITISVAILATVLLSLSKAGHHAATTLGRAIGSIWMAVATSMFLLFLSLGFSGRLNDQHVFVAVLSAMLGMANGASALILRWRVQFACAIAWWVTAVTSCFGTDAQSIVLYLVALFLCQIVFGIYAIMGEVQARKRRTRGDA